MDGVTCAKPSGVNCAVLPLSRNGCHKTEYANQKMSDAMVSGRLQEKNGYYYMVLSYTGADGKRKQPWHATGLPVKGNKKRAEEMLRELRRSFTPPKPNRKEELSPDMLFSDYMLYWLKIIRPAVQETTWSSYNFNVKNHIVPYFEPTGITLGGLQARHIQSFYLH